jgi:indolepyruvate ferredoxin oxidoreductase alpha subunit
LPDLRVLLEDKPGKRVLLLGNEAVARGILEAGIGVVTTYHGTPASEIGDSVSAIAAEAGLYMEYSTNEIVAVEVAAGAANCRVRALTAMKHVGLNVAADAVMTLAYVGVSGGYVIVNADDPQCYSSQNEQDNRFYALLSNLPCLEPSNAQEAKDMVGSAVEISEKLELPVLLRTTTRVSHTRGPVTYGKLAKPKLKGEFVRDVRRMVMVPANARPMHEMLLKKVEEAKEISEASPYNKVVREGKNREFGVISSGSAYNYAAEAVDFLRLDASVLKLGMIHPFPEKKIADFLKSHEKIVVVEELEPFLEMQVKAIAKDYAPNVEIYGKMNTLYFPRKGELSTRLVITGLAEITHKKLPINFREIYERYAETAKDLPPRPPVLCAGCPHRASFYVIKKVTGGKAIYPTDIGCYALGIAPPLKIGDILTCMGASVSTAQGISKVTGLDTIPVIGDSTFFHAAIPGLVNAVYNNHKITLVVLDNLTTAMTGNQPHPGIGVTGMGTLSQKVLIEKVAEGCGVKYVRVVNPFKIKEAVAVLKEALQQLGPSVVVFRAPCALMVARERRRKGARTVPCKITDECTDCLACIKLLGCPALVLKDEKVGIEEALCTACGLCVSVCPYNAIRCGESVKGD